MFRQLGQRPPESEMRAMIEAVDFDGSGTIDFEEFCLLMLRQQRAAATPDWLASLFVPPTAAWNKRPQSYPTLTLRSLRQFVLLRRMSLHSH